MFLLNINIEKPLVGFLHPYFAISFSAFCVMFHYITKILFKNTKYFTYKLIARDILVLLSIFLAYNIFVIESVKYSGWPWGNSELKLFISLVIEVLIGLVIFVRLLNILIQKHLTNRIVYNQHSFALGALLSILTSVFYFIYENFI